MPLLQAATDGEATSAFGEGSSRTPGLGVDVIAELERVRANLFALAEVIAEIRQRFHAHTHDGMVASPPANEQIAGEFLVQ
jgi:hypothetical protein